MVRGISSSSSPSYLRHKNGTLGCCLPPVASTRNVSPSLSGHGGGRGGGSLHRVSLTAPKSSKTVLRQFMSPFTPPRGPTSHYGDHHSGGVIGTPVHSLTGTRGGGGGGGGGGGERGMLQQPEASRTQLLVGRKQAF